MEEKATCEVISRRECGRAIVCVGIKLLVETHDLQNKISLSLSLSSFSRLNIHLSGDLDAVLFHCPRGEGDESLHLILGRVHSALGHQAAALRAIV